MNLSVLLPTRNGGNYLEGCIRSVLQHDSADLELVVSDNANTDKTSEVLERFSDDRRMKVLRSETLLSVTENWNRALEGASGDYILMIGDDDLLLPSLVSTIATAVDEYGYPDCITYNAYSFVAPSSVRESDQAYYSDSHFIFGEEFRSNRMLDARLREQIVRDLFRFRPRLPLNMQTTITSRAALGRLRSPVFRAPFPDHFALCGLLLTAGSWLYLDHRLLVVGLSPKSFGHFVYSGEGDAGLDYLGIDVSFPGTLPGNDLINGMHVWLSMVGSEYRDLIPGAKISRRDYVARQIWAWYSQCRQGNLGLREVVQRFRLLRPRDYLGLARLGVDPEFLRLAWRRVRSRKGMDLVWPRLTPIDDVETITEFRDVILKSTDV